MSHYQLYALNQRAHTSTQEAIHVPHLPPDLHIMGDSTKHNSCIPPPQFPPPYPIILCRLLPWTPHLPRSLTSLLVFQSHLLILCSNTNKKSTAIEFSCQPDPAPVPWVLFPQLFHFGDLGRAEVVFLYMTLLQSRWKLHACKY